MKKDILEEVQRMIGNGENQDNETEEALVSKLVQERFMVLDEVVFTAETAWQTAERI